MLTDFGKLCRKMRIDRNELLADMAKKVYVSPAFLSAVENGKRNVPSTLLEALEAAYNLSEVECKDLRMAAERSVRQIKIELEQMDDDSRNLVLAFARNIDKIDEQRRKKLMELLK